MSQGIEMFLSYEILRLGNVFDEYVKPPTENTFLSLWKQVANLLRQLSDCSVLETNPVHLEISVAIHLLR